MSLPRYTHTRFQPWAAGGKWPEPRRGDRKDGAGPVRSFVPDGTRIVFTLQPSDESLGYFRASLRDVESRHAKHVRPSAVRSVSDREPSSVFSVAAGILPAVEPGILPGGFSRGLRRHFRVQSFHSGRQDATHYGSQDGCRYRFAAGFLA